MRTGDASAEAVAGRERAMAIRLAPRAVLRPAIVRVVPVYARTLSKSEEEGGGLVRARWVLRTGGADAGGAGGSLDRAAALGAASVAAVLRQQARHALRMRRSATPSRARSERVWHGCQMAERPAGQKSRGETHVAFAELDGVGHGLARRGGRAVPVEGVEEVRG